VALYQKSTLGDLPDDVRKRRWSVRITTHNRRARPLGIQGKLTVAGWLAVLAAYQGQYAVCGDATFMCIDHRVPLNQGGSNTDDNLQPLCRDCNSAKRDGRSFEPKWWLKL
jgi:5-methylcytosine-specific restriction endonuclease McrA